MEIIKNTLETTRILPGQLELEITESVLMSDEFDTQHLFDNLVSLGVKIAIDDFGTGYSSLSYLKRFPVHTLKIDRTFISEIPDDQNTITIAYSIIALAQALNMIVVAEGIETKEQLDILEARSCDYGQGYYYSKPVSQESFTNFLLQQNETKSITAKKSGYK